MVDTSTNCDGVVVVVFIQFWKETISLCLASFVGFVDNSSAGRMDIMIVLIGRATADY